MEIRNLHHMNVNAVVTSPFSLSWSEDNKIAVVTKEGLVIMAGLIPTLNGCRPRPGPTLLSCLWFALMICVVMLSPVVSGSNNITDVVFGSATDVMPAAFGDFNSDELTDMFVLRDNGQTVQVLLASRNEPFLEADPNLRCHFDNLLITSLVPGDFDGDSKMDILVTTIDRKENGPKTTLVFVHWGEIHSINCSNESTPLMKLRGQPLAIDYNRDNIVDLFGSDLDGNRTIWLFNKNRTSPKAIFLVGSENKPHLRAPHSHAFLDTNGDFAADLVISTTEGFEVWQGIVDSPGFVYNTSITLPRGILITNGTGILGQSVFLDLAQTGKLDHIVPVCYDAKCKNSSLLVLHQGKWVDLSPSLTDPSGRAWGFVPPNGHRYTDTLTVRVGDFNMDGYFDLVATLQLGSNGDEMRSYLLENTACVRGACKSVGRTFTVRWGELSPLSNQSVMATFYDVHQDGVLDVIIAGNERVQAFRIDLEYDSNFIKVMVGVQGGNLPGPWISYKTTTQEGDPKMSAATQLPQSGHFSLALPYVIFGLGRTPNFVDTLVVGLGGQHKEWTQIIPNSQMVVVLTQGWPSWKAKLFVTPSKLILLSVLALTCTCVLIAAIIGVLYWKERREDRLERLQEAHKFHFDAM